MSEIPQTPRTALRNIETVAQLEEEFLRSRSLADKISDVIAGFVGSILFVAIHLVWFAGWVLINLHLVPFLPAFDPYPYQLLCMLVSLEGVLLSTFVLIKQNRMSQRADHRSHLDLQVNLLSEKEVTKLIQMQRLICRRLGISETESDAEVLELSESTAVENLAKELDESMPEG
jgi:uncharacterized membrane protein